MSYCILIDCATNIFSSHKVKLKEMKIFHHQQILHPHTTLFLYFCWLGNEHMSLRWKYFITNYFFLLKCHQKLRDTLTLITYFHTHTQILKSWPEKTPSTNPHFSLALEPPLSQVLKLWLEKTISINHLFYFALKLLYSLSHLSRLCMQTLLSKKTFCAKLLFYLTINLSPQKEKNNNNN